MNSLSIHQEMNLPDSNLLQREWKLWKASRKRQGRSHFEPFEAYPQCLFFLKTPDAFWVGRKWLSREHREGNLLEPHCSMIDQSMIWGTLSSFQVSQEGILIYFNRVDKAATSAAFQQLLNNPSQCEITFPFCYFIEGTRRERKSPEEGWRLTEERMSNLASGEELLRQYTMRFLATQSLKKKVAFDPACSTGHFLSDVKRHFPELTVVGQDLSRDMVNEARKRVAVVHHGDAKVPRVPDQSIDFLFSRFLNSEVVTMRQAHELFQALGRVLKPDGLFILLGHTPILLNRDSFEAYGYEAIHSVGRYRRNLFQYYVLRKNKGALPS